MPQVQGRGKSSGGWGQHRETPQNNEDIVAFQSQVATNSLWTIHWPRRRTITMSCEEHQNNTATLGTQTQIIPAYIMAHENGGGMELSFLITHVGFLDSTMPGEKELQFLKFWWACWSQLWSQWLQKTLWFCSASSVGSSNEVLWKPWRCTSEISLQGITSQGSAVSSQPPSAELWSIQTEACLLR